MAFNLKNIVNETIDNAKQTVRDNWDFAKEKYKVIAIPAAKVKQFNEFLEKSPKLKGILKYGAMAVGTTLVAYQVDQKIFNAKGQDFIAQQYNAITWDENAITADKTKADTQNSAKFTDNNNNTNATTTVITDYKEQEEQATKFEALDGDGNPFKIVNGKLVVTDIIPGTNIQEAVKHYNNIGMKNVYKNISFSAIEVILDDKTLTADQQKNAILMIFELSMRQFGYNLSRIGGDGETRTYKGNKKYIAEVVEELKSTRANIDNIAYFNTHDYLNEYNLTYKANYKKAKELFNAKARTICGKIAAKNKLTTNESNAYLMPTYRIRQDDLTEWTYRTTKDKKNFLILYDNASWNTATAGKINQEFARLMRKMKKDMKTDESLERTIRPQVPVDDLSGDESDFDI